MQLTCVVLLAVSLTSCASKGVGGTPVIPDARPDSNDTIVVSVMTSVAETSDGSAGGRVSLQASPADEPKLAGKVDVALESGGGAVGTAETLQIDRETWRSIITNPHVWTVTFDEGQWSISNDGRDGEEVRTSPGDEGASSIERGKAVPRQVHESEPNDERTSAGAMRADGSATGAVDGTRDRIDQWVVHPERDGLMTVTATTTGGAGGARLNKVTVFDETKEVAGGSKKPFKLGNPLPFGPIRVEVGRRYFVVVEGAGRGRYTEYLLETTLASDG